MTRRGVRVRTPRYPSRGSGRRPLPIRAWTECPPGPHETPGGQSRPEDVVPSATLRRGRVECHRVTQGLGFSVVISRCRIFGVWRRAAEVGRNRYSRRSVVFRVPLRGPTATLTNVGRKFFLRSLCPSFPPVLSLTLTIGGPSTEV